METIRGGKAGHAAYGRSLHESPCHNTLTIRMVRPLHSLQVGQTYFNPYHQLAQPNRHLYDTYQTAPNLLISNPPKMPAAKDWESKAQICRDVQQASIQKQWLLPEDKLPTKLTHNVTRVPYDSGILSAEELEMTEQDASGLLKRYQSGEWTVEQVTTAFLKRATIGQQLVSYTC